MKYADCGVVVMYKQFLHVGPGDRGIPDQWLYFVFIIYYIRVA